VRIHLEKVRRTEKIAHRLDATGVAEIFSNLKVADPTSGPDQRGQVSPGRRTPDPDPIGIYSERLGMSPQPPGGGFAIF
jgi:hypothetical protein